MLAVRPSKKFDEIEGKYLDGALAKKNSRCKERAFPHVLQLNGGGYYSQMPSAELH